MTGTSLRRVFKDVLWWGVPVGMVLLFTVGFYPMIIFSLVAGTVAGILRIPRKRSNRSLLSSLFMVAALLGSVAISPRTAQAEELNLTVEVAVCIDQEGETRGGETGSGQDCTTWEEIKMGFKCATCSGLAMVCPYLVSIAVSTPTPHTIGLALADCAAGAWACMECAEDLRACGYEQRAKEALVKLARIKSSICLIRELYETICRHIEDETGQPICPEWPWWLGCG